MNPHRKSRKASIQLETLEGRMVLNATAHPIHNLTTAHTAPAHVAVTATHPSTHKAPAVPNPVLVNLTPGPTGITITDVSYDPRIHLITVKGVIDVTNQLPPTDYGYPAPSYPDVSSINVSVVQSVNQFRSVYGYSSSNVGIADATVKKVAFKEQLLASPGEFTSGNIMLTVNAYRDYYYSSTAISVIAHMRKLNAY